MAKEKSTHEIDGRKCKVCSDKTKNIFNIKFKPMPICEQCAKSIFIQQAAWYIDNDNAQTKNNQ